MKFIIHFSGADDGRRSTNANTGAGEVFMHFSGAGEAGELFIYTLCGNLFGNQLV